MKQLSIEVPTNEQPPALAWFTSNIGVHHVHDLSSHIPFYRLPEVLRDHPQLASRGRLTFLQSLRCASSAVWDERQKRLISFRDAHGASSLSDTPPSSSGHRGIFPKSYKGRR